MQNLKGCASTFTMSSEILTPEWFAKGLLAIITLGTKTCISTAPGFSVRCCTNLAIPAPLTAVTLTVTHSHQLTLIMHIKKGGKLCQQFFPPIQVFPQIANHGHSQRAQETARC